MRMVLDWDAIDRLAASVWPRSGRPCGARTRSGGRCRGLPMVGKKRCRMHGGKSTGPKTPEGRAAIAASNRRRTRRHGGCQLPAELAAGGEG